MTLPSAAQPSRAWAVALVLISTAGGLALDLGTQPLGLGISSDSVLYLGSAEQLAAGHGYTRLTGDGSYEPVTHFPPGFPLLLAAASFFGLDVLRGALLLQSVLFAGSVFLIGLSVHRATGRWPAAAVAAAIAATSPILFGSFVWVMSEGLYLFASLLALVSLDSFRRTGSRGAFVVSAGAAGGALLTRYVGGACIVAAAGYLLLRGPTPLRKRVPAASAFILIAGTPMLLWLGANLARGQAVTNRTLAWHPLPISALKIPMGLIWEWLLPFEFTQAGLWIMAVLFAMAAALAIRGMARRRSPSSGPSGFSSELSGLHAIYAAAYVGFLLASVTLYDASTPIDSRLTMPVYASGLIVVVAEVSNRLRRSSGVLRALAAAGILLVIGSYVYRTSALLAFAAQEGFGYASRGWQQAAIREPLRLLPQELALYSNNPEAVYILCGRGAFGLPASYDMVRQTPNPGYEAAVARVTDRIRARGGAIIVVGKLSDRESLEIGALVEGMNLIYEGADGRIYTLPGPGDA